MATVEIGRLCVKLAGRDAGKECLIVEVKDKNFVVVDGNTRRKRVNIDHLEILQQKADIKKGASHEDVVKALGELGIKAEAKSPPRQKNAAEAKPAAKEAKTEGKPKKAKTEK